MTKGNPRGTKSVSYTHLDVYKRQVLRRIDIPAMLVYGGQSNFYSNDTARYVAREIPDAILLSLIHI